ncbi:hypothetical protein LVY74_11775 [Acinetobacter sp. ME22]|uniref:hypothetical protein n=1 Tax=Acinetobacter sp. ME22 TaxID=2904802 RepID=UPI001EDA4204|nr:hypothetical protein [Acinetobacter sp. ME22]MCG2574229.1 hypothetical protein [Acinetobacter sp. ME22]
MKKTILGSLVSTFILTGCSMSPITLPSNVSTVPTGMGQSTYIDHVNYSFIPSKIVSFDNVKACAVTVFTNDGVMLMDNAGSFFGAYTGNYYQKQNSQYINGGNVFKYVDDKNNILIATGNKKTRPQQAGLVTDIVKYDAKVVLKNNQIELIFQNIGAAQESTGSIKNSGFRQIGTWSGARAPAALDTLQMLSNGFKDCLN